MSFKVTLLSAIFACSTASAMADVNCGGVDDTAALTAAVNAATQANPNVVVHGICKLPGPTIIPRFATAVPGHAIGDDPWSTVFVLGQNYIGDLFGWAENWPAQGAFPGNGPTAILPARWGPSARNFSVVGNITAAGPQYALHMYDRNDQIRIDNVNGFYVNGPCLSVGDLKTTTQSWIRESHIHHMMCFNSGAPGLAAMDFNPTGNGPSGTPVDISDIDIFGPNGPGFRMRTAATAAPMNGYRIRGLRVEGLQQGTAQADLVDIGDPVEGGQISNIWIDQMQLVSPYPGFCGIRFSAPSAALRPFGIDIRQAMVGRGGGTGKGVCIDALRTSVLQFDQISTVDTNITIGPASMVGDLIIDGHGDESSWTIVMDPSNITKPYRVPVVQ